MSQSVHIQLSDVSKKFGSEWIFKGITTSFDSTKSYAITGPNGSGKSTLLKVIAGMVTPNRGEANWKIQEKSVPIDELYKYVAYCAPYLELPEELNLLELLQFHQQLRALTISEKDFIAELQLEPTKEIRLYSSGMKQRLKLALAFYSKSEILLLDEPTATLDETWATWYITQVKKQIQEKLVIICSNENAEYEFCDSIIKLQDYKTT
jgi:ABC-type multidrug transport system ATPase subunit